jgi:hypothetical protein
MVAVDGRNWTDQTRDCRSRLPVQFKSGGGAEVVKAL